MCSYLGFEVLKLKRTRIMNVSLANLKYGDWRELTNEEMSEINKMISTSSKTEEASVIKDKPKQNTVQKKDTSRKTVLNKKSAEFRKSSSKNKYRKGKNSSNKKEGFSLKGLRLI